MRRREPWAVGVLIVALAAGGALPPQARAASPELAAAASFFLPGLGQAANGDYDEGALQFSAALVFAHQYGLLTDRGDYVKPEDRVDSEQHLIHTNRTSFESELWLTALFDLQLYSAYGAYRDGRRLEFNAGYNTPLPSESFGDLVSAPFRWDNLSRPTTFVILLLPLYAVLSPPSPNQYLYQPEGSLTRDQMAAGLFLGNNMVAVGEESFFRGLLNNGLSSVWGETWGLVGSSLLFGLAHQGNAGQATPLGASLFGAYLGYLQQQNDYRIGQGVAIHFWWNFLVSLSMLHQREATQPVTLFSYATRF